MDVADTNEGKTMKTYLHERADGVKEEYRLGAHSDRECMFIQYRVLRPDGWPYPGDEWHCLRDVRYEWLYQNAPEIYAAIQAEHRDQFVEPAAK